MDEPEQMVLKFANDVPVPMAAPSSLDIRVVRRHQVNGHLIRRLRSAGNTNACIRNRDFDDPPGHAAVGRLSSRIGAAWSRRSRSGRFELSLKLQGQRVTCAEGKLGDVQARRRKYRH